MTFAGSDKKRILVAMSGGVDSSVTAALLKNQGHEVIGVYMQLWDPKAAAESSFGGRCCSRSGSEFAKKVCNKLDIPYSVINAQDIFQDKVVDYYVHEYLQNRTPNPCAQCNSQIKFNYLFQKADELGCEWVATGHYSQVIIDSTSQIAHLHKAADIHKDQTYFLFGLTQEALKRVLMPLGGLTETMVQRLAQEYEFASPEAVDSQDICFIHNERSKSFINQRVPKLLRPVGMIRTPEGAIVGEHEGLHLYSIGQNTGLPLRVKDPDHYFVLGFDAKTQALIVGDEKYLYSQDLMASSMNWIRPIDQLHGIRCNARISPHSGDIPCLVTCFENNKIHVEFDESQRAVTPGQAVVFYDENEVLGGAFIDTTGASRDIA